MYLYLDDVDKVVARLRAEAVKVLKGPADMPWGERIATIADPDGNPVLIVVGHDDQIVPLDDSGRLSVQIGKDATLKIYPGAPHGLANTTACKDTLNADLLAFLRN
jgi:alpha-beta hydrolase superfamily lysophospholipase